jgi:hypothetical protein
MGDAAPQPQEDDRAASEDPMIESARARITRFALDHRLLVMGEFKPMAEAGALIRYGPNQVARWGDVLPTMSTRF